MNLKNKTNEILNMYNIRAKKKYGQNFLVDENILDSIVTGAGISNNDIVIEIGPGLGNLTEKLLEKAKLVIAFEIDEDMCNILRDRFEGNCKFVLLNQDVLKANIDDILNKYSKEYSQVKLVANLPYYITTPIMFKIFENTSFISSMTIMVQKEVADRIVATPKGKDYGVLTVTTKFYGEAVKLLDVPNSSFIPAPNVTSSVVNINVVQKYDVKNREVFFKLVKAAFSQRRKKIINSLENSKAFDVSKEKLQSIIKDNNVNENARAEEIDIQTYVDIANELQDML